MYSNNILNFQASTPILDACTKKSGILLNTLRIYIYIYIYICLIYNKEKEKKIRQVNVNKTQRNKQSNTTLEDDQWNGRNRLG